MWPRRSGSSCTTRSGRSTRGRLTACTASAQRPRCDGRSTGSATRRSRSMRSPRPTWWRCWRGAAPNPPRLKPPPPPRRRARRGAARGKPAPHTRRLRRAQDVGLWNTAYDIAISNVGERETPAGSRRIDCTDWYGVPAPWSAIFVSWCYARAGSMAFSAGARYAYVPHILWDAQRGENQLSITRRPLPGDLPVFDLDGDGVADHVAMFDDWTGQRGTTFCTIEGNVTSSGEPNGGRIAQLERRADHRVMAFVHVRG